MKEIEYSKLPYYRAKTVISKSQDQIKKVLQKFGLQGIRFTEYRNLGVIEFILKQKNNNELTFRFQFSLPDNDMHQRQIYRALYHYLKNRFMSVEFGITTIEKEFLQELVLKLPDGSTPTIKEIVESQLSNLEYKSELQLPFKKKREVKENDEI